MEQEICQMLLFEVIRKFVICLFFSLFSSAFSFGLCVAECTDDSCPVIVILRSLFPYLMF